MPIPDLMKDSLEVHKKTGEVIKELKGSVQNDKIFMNANGVYIEEGDTISRITSLGHVNFYEVLDPGFHERFGSIDANYQMKVRNLASKPQSNQAYVVYNNNNNISITGPNARITNGSDQSTNYAPHNNTEIIAHILELKEAVEAARGLTSIQVKEALEIVDQVSQYSLKGNPNPSLLKALISALPDVASIATAGSALLALLV